MHKKIFPIIFMFVLFFILLSSGCMDMVLDPSTTYQAQPTKIRYDIRYGYTFYCNGSGEYEIHYRCDKPQVLNGLVSSLQKLYSEGGEDSVVAGNSVVVWNLSGTTANTYTLGISATIDKESYLVSDLTGANALTVSEIVSSYPDIVSEYGHTQAMDEIVYIDPTNADIKRTATEIQEQTKTTNAYMLAQSLFTWLKENTRYQIHEEQNGVQPAQTTYQIKTGDCDDLSILYISLCRSVGVPARLIRGYLLEDISGTPIVGPHAWAEVFVGGTVGNNGWVPVECASTADNVQIEIHQNFGIEDVSHLRVYVDNGSNESLNSSYSSISWIYDPSMKISPSPFIEIENYVILESKQLVVTKEGNRSYKST